MREPTRHLLFLDECGTHDMARVDPAFPIFVLLGLLVGETYYAHTLVPRIKALKDRFEIPRDTGLHSRDIRRHIGVFEFLKDVARRIAFYEALNDLVAGLRIRLFAITIDKRMLLKRFIVPVNPYDMSISQMLSIVCGPPGVGGAWRPNVARIIAESRGWREDRELQDTYQGFKQRGLWNYGSPTVTNRKAQTVQRVFPRRVEFARKKSSVVAGLELADLAAYPIARAIVNKDWSNPACQVVAMKLAGIIQT
ncbi:MAG: hypothetical protein LLF89_06090 [Spirochaetaceae bacterium]|nr:hypothetical protein [Spirochaetaceae bacterium]